MIFEEDTNEPESGLTRERVARSFMKALRDGDIDKALRYTGPAMRAKPDFKSSLERNAAGLREVYDIHGEELKPFISFCRMVLGAGKMGEGECTRHSRGGQGRRTKR